MIYEEIELDYMKKILRSSGIVIALLAVLSTLLMQFGEAVLSLYEDSDPTIWRGQEVLFETATSGYYGPVYHSPSRLAIFVYITITIISLALAFTFFLSNRKNNTAYALSGTIVSASAVMLLVAGICVFSIPSDYIARDDLNLAVGGDYLAVALISIFSSLLCVPVAIANFKSIEKAAKDSGSSETKE